MPIDTHGPCEWPLYTPSADSTCPPCEALESLPAADRQRVEEMTVDLLWNWTRRKFGLCTEEVRPCRITCTNEVATFWGREHGGGSIPQVSGWTPALVGGEWFNIWCGACGISKCTCGENDSRALVLPGPVHSVTEVIVDGSVLDPSAYRLRKGTLWRTDGQGWPDCNDPVADPLAPNSPAWTITYKRGYEVPQGGQIAAYTLACELSMALCGDSGCSLPQRVQSITREGVTMSILDGFEGLEEGKTGIWDIDAWITSVTMDRPSPPRVYSPDLPSQKDTMGALGRGGRGTW